MTDTNFGRFGSGKPVRRVEDAALLVGKGVFVDDVNEAGQAALQFLRSPYAHARITAIDTSAALAMPGVLAVYTGADLVAAGVKPMPFAAMFKRPDGGDCATPARHVLAADAVRYVGEMVAAVVAETRQQARDAAEAIVVDFEELPAVVDSVDATAPGAALVWPAATGGIACEMRHGNADATTAAFAKAAHVVSLEVVNQRLHPAPIEPRSVLAGYDAGTGRLTVRLSSQMPTAVRDGVAGLIGIPADKVRVVVGDVGGGFGMKTGLYPEDVVAGFAAWTLKRSVKWQGDRSDDFLGAIHGRDLVTRSEMALDADGKVLAIRYHSLANVGAYATPTGCAIQLLIGPWVTTSIYDIQTIDLRLQAVLTNTMPTGAYRGAGRPEAIYNIERLFDAASRKLGLDPAEIRRRNMIAPTQMPYKNAMGQTYDSGKFEQVLNQGLKLADWTGFEARAAESAKHGKLRGRGIATFLEWTSGNAFEENVTVTVTPDHVEIFSATQAMGQGIVTSYAQLAVDAFGVPIEKIRIVQGDTDRGNGFGSAGSRSLFTGGSAVKVGAEKTIDTARQFAAEELEVSPTDVEYVAGDFTVAGTDRKISLFQVAAKRPNATIALDANAKVAGPTWPNGCHVCEVEIDPATGHVQVVGYASVNDVGRVVNPMIVRGQLDGGAVQGIGQALTEAMVYDRDSGQPVTGSFMDYAMPRADVTLGFSTEMDESTPCLTNILGVKGVGELGTIGATPAVVNAVADALARAGKREAADTLQMPVTAERVWRALR